MPVRVSELRAGTRDQFGSLLFERVDAFSFVDRKQGRMVTRAHPLERVTIATVRSSGHDISLFEPGNLTFILPIRGHIAIEAEGASLEAGAGGGVFLRAGHRKTAVRANDRGEFVALAAIAPAAPVGPHGARVSPGRAFRSVSQDVVASTLDGYLRFLASALERPDSPLLKPAVMRASEALVRELFAELDGADVSRGEDRTATPASRVRMAEDLMRARCDDPLTMDDVAQAVGVGTRALQIAFRSLRGSSPRTVLTAMRLERVRERLLAPDRAESVCDVALQSGFTHLGRFAAAYHARFGEYPSDTLRRSRG